MATGSALVIYPAGIEMDSSIESHYYGSGYGLGWGSAFFFLCAALCMSLDDLVRESANHSSDFQYYCPFRFQLDK
jgi:hypothetical protein